MRIQRFVRLLIASSLAASASEKVRHGKFFNIGGVMPLYSTESMTDQQIADVLAYIGL